MRQPTRRLFFPQVAAAVMTPKSESHQWQLSNAWLGRLSESWLARLRHFIVTFPTFILQLDVLDRDGIGIRIQIRQRLVLRDPATIDLVSERQLAGFVIDFNNHVLTKILERDFTA